MHGAAKILGGKGDYSSTYKAYAYSDTPVLLFGWLPIVNIAAGIYSLYIAVIGMSTLHKISTGRAFASIVIAFLFFVVVFAALILGGVFSWFGLDIFK